MPATTTIPNRTPSTYVKKRGDLQLRQGLLHSLRNDEECPFLGFRAAHSACNPLRRLDQVKLERKPKSARTIRGVRIARLTTMRACTCKHSVTYVATLDVRVAKHARQGLGLTLIKVHAQVLESRRVPRLPSGTSIAGDQPRDDLEALLKIFARLRVGAKTRPDDDCIVHDRNAPTPARRMQHASCKHTARRRACEACSRCRPCTYIFPSCRRRRRRGTTSHRRATFR